jgi:hypothetical protein
MSVKVSIKIPGRYCPYCLSVTRSNSIGEVGGNKGGFKLLGIKDFKCVKCVRILLKDVLLNEVDLRNVKIDRILI